MKFMWTALMSATAPLPWQTRQASVETRAGWAVVPFTDTGVVTSEDRVWYTAPPLVCMWPVAAGLSWQPMQAAVIGELAREDAFVMGATALAAVVGGVMVKTPVVADTEALKPAPKT